MIERHLAKLRLRHDIDAEEDAAIRDAVVEIRSFRAGETVIHAEELLHHSTLLLDGLMCRYKDLSEGQRQIAEIHVAGDFADLHSFLLKRLDHNIMTLTSCRAALVPHDRLRDITARFPHLTRVYWFATALDAAIHREWVLSLGRRKGLARLAALFCELHIRLGVVGLADERSFALDLTQPELAECLGLTPVHVNRTLRELREQRVMSFRNRQVEIYDPGALRQIAEFDPFYLYLGRQPRL